MSFPNKAPGRDFISRSNSNPNKAQNYRNTAPNSHFNNGISHMHDDKSQHSCNSPKILSESHSMPQYNTGPRDQYPYKNNTRPNTYRQNKPYNDKQSNYYNQRSSSPEESIIPEIDHLREFVKEQTDRFKMELSRHEGQKSSSPSPGCYQHPEQNTNKYSKTYANRTGNGLPASHSLGSISNNNIGVVPVDTSVVSPSCSDNPNRHQDARMGQAPFVTKNNNGCNNYTKHSSQSSGKPSPGLTRNLSHEDTFSKAPIVNKNRNDSPNSTMDKSINNKAQFPSPTGSSGGRPDPKKTNNFRSKQFSYANGSSNNQNNNPSMHQLNQNNNHNPCISPSSCASSSAGVIDVRKSSDAPLPRTMSAVVRNGGGNCNAVTKANVPPPLRKGGPHHSDMSTEPSCQSYRAVVSVTDSARHFSHPGNGNGSDSQDIGDTPTTASSTTTVPEQFFTPDPPASPCSTRSSPDNGYLSQQRGPRKALTSKVHNAGND